ncbi:MAG TPA: primosomal protein N', partial [Phycisphaerales bacterium]|nr:primosomal protein N' [Phycisphaerales bacterium]
MEQLSFRSEPDEQADDGPARFARVAVERGVDVEGLTYREGDTPLEPGDRVEVPLGRGNTPTGGVVIETGGPELLAGFDPERAKRVLRRTGRVLSGPMIELARWISRYYATPMGMVVASMVPVAVKQGVGVRTKSVLRRVEGATEPDRLPPAAGRAWAAIRAMDASCFPVEPADLVARCGLSNAGPLNRLVREGLLERAEVEHVRVFGDGTDALIEADQSVPTLTETQRAVVEGIDDATQRAPFGVHLIRGVTGSGKTEVYIRLIERTLARGRGAIVLVPEIALTPQTAGRFVARLGGEGGVEVMHSGLSASARHKAWARLASGASRVAVGARSAVFAPVENPGLIIVDEEHDTSYKQDQLPRYNARDVAIKRAQIENAHAVLGSATPSLESWHNAAGERPRYRLWELPHRVAGRLPRVRIVSPMQNEPGPGGDGSNGDRRGEAGRGEARSLFGGTIGIGPVLARALEETLDAGGQAILLLNRRGFASYVACPSPSCGWSLGCRACDARMVVHRAGARPGQHAPGGWLRCHHCLAEAKIPEKCPVCGVRLRLVGLGIQRVERELAERFGLVAGT